MARDIGTAMAVIAGVLTRRDQRDRSAVAVVSEDHTVQTGAGVMGDFGGVRAAADDNHRSPTQAARTVRHIGQHGMYLAGELRERAVAIRGKTRPERV